jgi:hypothetical protein
MIQKQELLKQLLEKLKELTDERSLVWFTGLRVTGVSFYAMTFFNGQTIQLLRTESTDPEIIIGNYHIAIDKELYDLGNELGDAITQCRHSSDEDAINSVLNRITEIEEFNSLFEKSEIVTCGEVKINEEMSSV